LWQEHEHCVDEERVVVNNHDTSVPLQRHLPLQSPLGARRRRPISASTSDRNWRKARLPRSYARSSPFLAAAAPGCPDRQGLARYLRKVFLTLFRSGRTLLGAHRPSAEVGGRGFFHQAARAVSAFGRRSGRLNRLGGVPCLRFHSRSARPFGQSRKEKWSAKRVSDKPRQTSSGATAKGCRHAVGGSAAPGAPSRQ